MSLTPLKTVGHPAQRIDAVKRVTGTATYTGEIQIPGMLYARVLRSPHAHARIRKIDTSKAQALPGVKAILTRENCDVVWSSGDTRNKRYLFNKRQIEVDYEVLPFVLDPEDALKSDAF